MRVVHVIDSGGMYGAEMVLLHLCKAQQKLDIDVEVISIGRKKDQKKPLEIRLEAENILCKKWRMLPLPDIRESSKIIKYCQATNSHVIHSHGYKGNILLALLPKFKRSVPIITTVHGYTSSRRIGKMALYEFLDKWALNRMDAVVLVSDGMRHQVSGHKLNKRIHIVPNGIPSDIAIDNSEPIELFSESALKIGAMGRLSYEKNFSLLIKSMPEVIDSIPSAKLVIYGEGNERHQLEKLVSRLNLENVVYMPGYIEDVSSLYRSAEVFANTSITEGMPITLLEALKYGCNIVATNIPANREVLQGTPDASNLTQFSTKEISRSFIEISKKSKFRLKKDKNERRRIFNEKYTSIVMAEKYLKLYEFAILRKE